MDKLTAAEIVALWPSPAKLAEDIGASPPLPRYWAKHNRIPPKWHDKILASAKSRRLLITAKELEAVK